MEGGYDYKERQILDIANHLAGLSLMCEHIGVSLHCIVQATADAGDE